MTKKQVKRAFQRGLGRGILAVREDPEQYKDLVLWACGKNLSFDTQCEGTRAWYSYQLISCYSDRTEFRDLIERRFRKKEPDPRWDHLYFSELLTFFAEDGDQTAEAVLWDKYEDLLFRLNGFRRASKIKRQTVECFEDVSVALSWKKENYFRIAENIGGLFSNSDQYDAWDFAWLHDSRPRSFHSELKRKSSFSKELTAYFSSFNDLRRELKNRSAERTEYRIPEGGRPLSVYLKRRAPELATAYAEAYLSQKDPEARAAALEAFSVCPYPMDPEPVLIDAESECSLLRTAAIEALCEVKDPKVRAFAWIHMDENTKNMLPIAIKNYTPEDEPLLKKYISGLRVDYACDSGWHGIYMDILDLFDEDAERIKPPKAFLPLLFESTLCSYCRERIVRLMGKYRMISDSMWKELLFDSNENIRAYANAHFRRSVSSV